jgi:hypothetical protein
MLPAGRCLGPYEALSPLGAGGMGQDGTRLVISTRAEGASTPLTLVFNWAAAIAK